MTPRRHRIALHLVLLCLAVAPAAAAAAPACPTATLTSARALAERAAAHLQRAGPEKSFPAFMDPKGGFMSGDLYVWVFDVNGVMVANGRYPQYVGSQIGLGYGGGGGGLGDAIVARALKAQRGWVEYRWYSPCTRRMGPKIAWFVKVGRYIVGVGAYPKAGV